MGSGGPEGSGRALRLDPHTLPVRFVAQDGGADGQTRQVELCRDRVVVRRAVRGIPMKVGVPVASFRGVSLRMLAPLGADGAAVAVMLDHPDCGLSVPLFIATDGDEAVALWKCWGRVLGLPLLVLEDDGTLSTPFPRLGALDIGAPTQRRRRRSAIRRRRPSILMRRKTGRPSTTPTVYRGEREIIARN